MALGAGESSTAAGKLRRIESVTDSALAGLDVKTLLTELLDRTKELLDVDTAAALLVDTPSQQLVATAARGLEEEVYQGVRLPLGQGFAGRVAADRRAVALDRVDDTTVLNRLLWQRGLRSLLGVPMIAYGSVVGVLHVGTFTTRQFSSDDVGLLQVVADRAALAVRDQSSYADRVAATVLQRSLLPAQPPAIPGMDLAARYVPGGDESVAGDWYDVFPLTSGWYGIVMGDVLGSGLDAAVVMGRLRSALRAYALYSDDPAEVLERLDAKACHFEPDMMATVVYAMVEPFRGRLLLSSAGHLAPVLRYPNQDAVLMDLPTAPPVGVGATPRRHAVDLDLPPDTLVCFYTDGLVERRNRPLDDGLERLRGSVTDLPTEQLCAELMRELVGQEAGDDDIALLAIRRQHVTDISPLSLEEPAVSRALSDVRSEMQLWLDAAGAGQEATTDLLLAVDEACANVVEHAYGPGGGTFSVYLELQSGTVLATVRDSGSWRRPPRPHDGRGMQVIRGCSDDFRLDRDHGGTCVTIRRRLS